VPTVAALKSAITNEQAPAAPALEMVALLNKHREALFVGLTAAGSDVIAHDSLLGWLRVEMGQSQNTILWMVVAYQ